MGSLAERPLYRIPRHNRTVCKRPQLCRLAEPNEWQVSGGEGRTPNGDNGSNAASIAVADG